MKNIILILLLSIQFTAFGQVGIGDGTPHDSAILDLATTNKGILFPRMTSTERIAIVTPIKGLHVYDNTTNSLWFHDGSNWINYATLAKYGDIKSALFANDHDGWVKLDGRSSASLTTTQRAVLTSLGITGDLPNATNAYLTQNNTTLGSVTGTNTTILTQANLPSLTFSGTATNGGGHNHGFDPAAVNTTTNGAHSHSMSFNNDDYNNWGGGNTSLDNDGGGIYYRYTSTEGNHAHSVDIPYTTSTSVSDHTHTVTVSSGGSATPINIAPRSLSVNMFIYLGF